MDPETIRLPDFAIHLSYDIDAPPPHPGSEWTRFVCLSDTHSQSFKVPPGDVLLHSGDLTTVGRVSQIKKTMDWINGLPHPIKIVIAGNHDLALNTEWYKTHWEDHHWSHKEDVAAAKELVVGTAAHRGRVTYLENSCIEVRVKENGNFWKIYGIPDTPEFCGWAFAYERGEAANIFRAIPKDTDILLTHGPPHGVLDQTIGGDNAGCEDLLKKLDEVRPLLHVFGHIHEARGVEVQDWSQRSETVESQRTVHVNAANSPLGPKARQLRGRGLSVVTGGPGWQPIIVDIFDPVIENRDNK